MQQRAGLRSLVIKTQSNTGTQGVSDQQVVSLADLHIRDSNCKFLVHSATPSFFNKKFKDLMSGDRSRRHGTVLLSQTKFPPIVIR